MGYTKFTEGYKWYFPTERPLKEIFKCTMEMIEPAQDRTPGEVRDL